MPCVCMHYMYMYVCVYVCGGCVVAAWCSGYVLGSGCEAIDVQKCRKIVHPIPQSHGTARHSTGCPPVPL